MSSEFIASASNFCLGSTLLGSPSTGESLEKVLFDPERIEISPQSEEAQLAELINRHTVFHCERSSGRFEVFDGAIYDQSGYLVSLYELKQRGSRQQRRIPEPFDSELLSFDKWQAALSVLSLTRTQVLLFFRRITDPLGLYLVFPMTRAVFSPERYRIVHRAPYNGRNAGPKVLIPLEELIRLELPRESSRLKTILDKSRVR